MIDAPKPATTTNPTEIGEPPKKRKTLKQLSGGKKKWKRTAVLAMYAHDYGIPHPAMQPRVKIRKACHNCGEPVKHKKYSLCKSCVDLIRPLNQAQEVQK